MTRNKHKTSLVLFSILYWVLVTLYFVTIRYAGLGDYAPPDLYYSDLIIYGASVGFITGLLFGLFPLNRIPLFKKRKSFLTVLLIGTGCHILLFMTIIFLASLYGNTISFALSFVFSPTGLAVLFHLSAASLFYHFILQINKKFGPGILLEYALGKYFNPKEEDRAFMFLDLKSSTQIAERLEHVTYSRMMQDCYAELTEPLLIYKAQIYQYVGDEVVVSWKMNDLFQAESCYDFFFAFGRKLEDKKDHFIREYGVCPQFKAGIHCGKVTVAEVGEIKTEIAYHGDVLNTASRIQSLCNSFQQDLLLSESFAAYVPEKDSDRLEFITETALRGKETVTKIFAMKASAL